MHSTAVSQSHSETVRQAWNRRYVTRVLRDSRTDREESLAALDRLSLLDDATKRLLDPLLRTYVVQTAALVRWPGWWWIYNTLRLATALAAVVAPALALVRWADAGSAVLMALSSYLLIGGVLALGYGVHQRRVRGRYVVVAAAAVAAVAGVALVAVPPGDRAWLWRGAAAGVLAVGGLLLLTVARLYALIAVRARLIRPPARRRGGWLLPPQLAAVRLLALVDAFEQARDSNRHPRYRRHFVRWLDEHIGSLHWELPTVVADLRFGPAVRRDTADKAGRLCAHLRRLQVRLMHDSGLAEHDAVASEVVALVAALAVGDWTPVAETEPESDQPSLAARLTRRLLPAALLGGAALALPYLPGVPAQSAALTGVQLGLVAAAALSLLPVEQTHRDQITTAFNAAAK